jgi:hypothetical protein
VLLKHIYLYLNLDEYPDELATPFGFETRYVCNFLERRLRALKFHAEGFSKICVQGCRVPGESCPIVPDKAALPTVRFDQQGYLSLRQTQRHEFFLAMLSEGLDKCARHHHIPIEELRRAIEDFRAGDCRNEWVHQTKLLRPTGLRATLMCSLDTKEFVLTLRLERSGTVVFEEPILETKPDELIFAHRFKEVVLDGDSVIVKDRFGAPAFSVAVPR